MNTCPFCRIAADESDSSSILGNKLATAFLDIHPIRTGHAIVIPKRHHADFLSLTNEEHTDILALARQLAEGQRKLFNPRRVGLLVAGFDVPHAHMHVVPMHEYHDLTSEALLKGTLKRVPNEELAAVRNAYAEHFQAAG